VGTVIIEGDVYWKLTFIGSWRLSIKNWSEVNVWM